MIHIRAWSEILYDAVPQSQLEHAYRRAMQENEDGFPLTAPKLITGFKRFCESQRTTPRIAQDSNLLNGEVCKRCHGTGMEEFVESGYKQMRRCDHVPVVSEEECPF